MRLSIFPHPLVTAIHYSRSLWTTFHAVLFTKICLFQIIKDPSLVFSMMPCVQKLQKHAWQSFKILLSVPQYLGVGLNIAPKIVWSHVHDKNINFVIKNNRSLRVRVRVRFILFCSELTLTGSCSCNKLQTLLRRKKFLRVKCLMDDLFRKSYFWFAI